MSAVRRAVSAGGRLATTPADVSGEEGIAGGGYSSKGVRSLRATEKGMRLATAV